MSTGTPLPAIVVDNLTTKELAGYHAGMVLTEAINAALTHLAVVKPGQLFHVDKAREFLEAAQAIAQPALDISGHRG